MRTKCIIFGEALRIRGKNFKQNLAENYSKSTKISISACKFSKFFRGSVPPDPPRAFFVSQSILNLFCRKNALEKCGKSWPPLWKFLTTPLGPVDPSSYSLTPFDPLDGPIDPWGSISTTLRTTALIEHHLSCHCRGR